MTTEEIQRMLDEIKFVADKGDYEVAHGNEDELAWKFIEYVATIDHGQLGEKAKLVLTSQQMDFARWCA